MPTQDEREPTPIGFADGLAWAGAAAMASLFVVVLGGATLLAWGLGDTDDPIGGGTTAADPADETDQLDLGEATFAGNCASCHGPSGEGGVGPGFDGITDRYPETADHMAVVSDGRGSMPAFGATLGDDEIEAVVAYERSVLDP